jgi:hypothetical protein
MQPASCARVSACSNRVVGRRLARRRALIRDIDVRFCVVMAAAQVTCGIAHDRRQHARGIVGLVAQRL